ncbi:methyl-accepting chemotaxis protein [Caldalkalibacillus uzonensis]|uniref:Methyl-accepting chemotaxis protein n=1 Tax=Caldalkalibacillus uzonensis TaxID=353224 RepID=A0ABU0CXZ6_9BACI|nr:methyl-accepting chemotaxis protein [Caldalkalibacillus uzonensis]MDQ0341020.1 methyl-accepting chemotaxis protein [Caldalkalibacillus uzonensis]
MTFKLRTKLVSISVLLLIVPALFIGILGYYTSKNSLDDLGATNLKNNVKMALNVIEVLNQEVKAGHLTLEEAQERAKIYLMGEKQADGTREISMNIDMGEHGYFTVIDEQGLTHLHPRLEGENVLELQDSSGAYFIQDFIRTAQEGGGFVYYDFGLPNAPDQIEPKVTYVELDPHWGWIVTAGTYMIDFNSEANTIFYALLWTLLVALVIGLIVIYFFSRHLSQPILNIVEYVQQIAKGHLDLEILQIKNKDEVGTLADNINHMTTHLREIITRVTDVAQQVATTSEQLSASSEETSKATEQITDSIQQVASGQEHQLNVTKELETVVHNMKGEVVQMTHHIQEVTHSASDTTQIAEDGLEVVERSVQQMQHINNTSAKMEAVSQELNEKAAEIEKVITLITDISEQTNLLALNAAIEAARAGEHGRGFAVVAEEVRKLAEQSTQAANQVSALIKEIQEETSKTTQVMNEGNAVVQEGTNLVNQAGEAFSRIAGSVKGVSDQLKAVNAAIQQITKATDHLLQSAQQTAQITEQSTGHSQNVAASAEEQNASMEEISAAASTLAKMAEDLQQLVSRFKV